MRNNNWVQLVPRNPDCDVISDQFFEQGKKGVIFKTGKCIINLHVLNYIYSAVVAQKEAGDIESFEEEGGVAVITGSHAADFMVCPSQGTPNHTLAPWHLSVNMSRLEAFPSATLSVLSSSSAWT